MTEETERARALRLARHARYNTSSKGKQRYDRYEEKHPERKTRWGVLMVLRARNRPPG